MAASGEGIAPASRHGRGLLKLLLAPSEKLLDALSDPARRNSALSVVLGGYVLAWTVYGIVSKSTQDIHPDTAELLAWSNELALGYWKHPPFGVYVVKAWTTIFPIEDWSFYLLGIANAALALWIAWRLSLSLLSEKMPAIGVALLTLTPFYNFLALNYNHNTLQMPLWAAATFFFLKSFDTRRPGYAALAGLAVGIGVLGKYWTVLLLPGFAIAALSDPRRRQYFRSAAPWISMLAGGLVVAPHLVWLYQNDFSAFAYASSGPPDRSIVSVGVAALNYLLAIPLYLAVPLAVFAIVARPSRAAIRDILFPPVGDRRLVAIVFWTPLLLPIPIALMLGVRLNSLWMIPAITLLPVVLLSSPLVGFTDRAATATVTTAIALPLLALLCAPIVAWNVFLHPNRNGASYYRELASAAHGLWRNDTGQPLKVLTGDRLPAVGIAFYSPGRLLVRPSRPLSGEQRAGALAVCRGRSADCAWLERLVNSDPRPRINEVTLSRRMLGWDGPPATFSILIVPPPS